MARRSRPRSRSRPSCCSRRAARGAGIGAAIFDVDGVLTDGRVYIGAAGEVVQGVLDARRPGPEAARRRPASCRSSSPAAIRRRCAGAWPTSASSTPPTARPTSWRRPRRCVDAPRPRLGSRRRDGRRLARPADPAPRRVRVRAAERARRGARGRPPRHRRPRPATARRASSATCCWSPPAATPSCCAARCSRSMARDELVSRAGERRLRGRRRGRPQLRRPRAGRRGALADAPARRRLGLPAAAADGVLALGHLVAGPQRAGRRRRRAPPRRCATRPTTR